MDPLILWTRQGLTWDLLDGTQQVDPSRGEYGDCAKHENAVGLVAQLIGTDQVVWCSRKRQYPHRGITERMDWELAVPRSSVIAALDEEGWNAFRQLPYREQDRRELAHLVHLGEAAEALLAPDSEAHILVPYPIRPSWEQKRISTRGRGWEEVQSSSSVQRPEG